MDKKLEKLESEKEKEYGFKQGTIGYETGLEVDKMKEIYLYFKNCDNSELAKEARNLAEYDTLVQKIIYERALEDFKKWLKSQGYETEG